MKKLIGSALVALSLLTQQAFAAVSITPATGGTAISADTASTTNWSTLGAIVIQEGSGGGNKDNFDSSVSPATLILKAPTGFQFNTAVTPNISVTNVAGGGRRSELADHRGDRFDHVDHHLQRQQRIKPRLNYYW